MISDKGGTALRYVHTLFEDGTLSGLTDGQLLKRFADRKGMASEAAFTILVEWHGPMVLRVCRSILADSHAAEDAFQATFLVLAQKAESLRTGDTIGPWLYQVAFRVASCARSAAVRRRKHEARVAALRVVSAHEDTPQDIGPIVHAEVNALPKCYRSVVVLCCLEGQSHVEAARQLGCPVGTVQSRLARGRERLRVRLARRGLAPSAVMVGMAASAKAAMPGQLLHSTARLASLLIAVQPAPSGAMSAGVRLLWKETLRSMFMEKVRFTLVGLVTIFALAAVACTFQAKGIAGPAAPKAQEKAPEPPIRGGQQEASPKSAPGRLDFGPLRVGATTAAVAELSFDEKDEWAELGVKVTPPRFLKVRGLRIRERTRGGKKVRLVEVGLAVDTSRTGEFSGKVSVEYGDQRIDLPVFAEVLPNEAKLTKVLVIMPGFGQVSDPEYYRPWFELVKSANLDVSYLDPSNEGLPGEVTGVDQEGLPVVPEWLKRYDVVLLADGGPVYINGLPVRILQSYVRSGGRLVVGASSFMLGSVPNTNAILKRFGLEMTDEDVIRGRAAGDKNWATFMVEGKPGQEDPLMKGVNSVAIRRGTPVRVTKGGKGEILLRDPKDESQGFAAVSRDGGEVVVLGPALLFQWLGEKEDGADNAIFLRNLLTKPQSR
ncbi:MAG: sigW 8 [Planctomycetota bacterium]|nr:sigW 8 [Planctomycetota bacterium]